MNDFSKHRFLCGSTPLIKITDKIYGKLETYNPTGSVKDRMVNYVVSHAIESGEICENTVLCEATSGNTGIALAATAAALDLECHIFMPSNMSEERKQMMSVYGAKLIDVPPNDFEKAIEMRDAFLASCPDAWSPNQFANERNIECHKEQTAEEIKNQVVELGEVWGAFVHGSGTGGTIEGVRQYCFENLPDTKIVMVIPAEDPHGIQGIGDGKDFLADPNNMDSTVIVKTEDSIARAKKFAQSTGLLVGISSGANILAAEEYLCKNTVEGIIVTMLCDRGERYMSIYGD